MSWQAHRAVTYHSKLTNVGLLRLLHVFAEHANSTGTIDPAPNQSTLADIFDCTDRTIRNRINVIIETGELKQTRVGSGPGNPSAYQICLPMPENGGNTDSEGGKMVETNPDVFSTFTEQLAEIKAEISGLKVEIFQLKAEKVETKGGKAHRENEPTNHYDPTLNQNIYIPPNPPKAERIDMAEIPPEALPDYGEQKQLSAYIEAIGTQVRDYYGAAKNREKFKDAAYMVIGYNETIEKVNGFDVYWQQYGWYENDGKASIDHFTDHWNDYVNGVDLRRSKPSKNGRHPQSKEQEYVGGAM